MPLRIRRADEWRHFSDSLLRQRSSLRWKCLLLILLLLVSCASVKPADATTPQREIRTDPGDPRATQAVAPPRAEITTCEKSLAKTRDEIISTLRTGGSGGFELTNARPWLALAYASGSSHSPYRFDRASVLMIHEVRASRPGTALRVELMPMRGWRRCTAVKLWEACSPELAPAGAPAEWHPCGGATSNAYRAATQLLQLHFGTESREED